MPSSNYGDGKPVNVLDNTWILYRWNIARQDRRCCLYEHNTISRLLYFVIYWWLHSCWDVWKVSFLLQGITSFRRMCFYTFSSYCENILTSKWVFNNPIWFLKSPCIFCQDRFMACRSGIYIYNAVVRRLCETKVLPSVCLSRSWYVTTSFAWFKQS